MKSFLMTIAAVFVGLAFALAVYFLFFVPIGYVATGAVFLLAILVILLLPISAIWTYDKGSRDIAISRTEIQQTVIAASSWFTGYGIAMGGGWQAFMANAGNATVLLGATLLGLACVVGVVETDLPASARNSLSFSARRIRRFLWTVPFLVVLPIWLGSRLPA